jgi:hypothetical protein
MSGNDKDHASNPQELDQPDFSSQHKEVDSFSGKGCAMQGKLSV